MQGRGGCPPEGRQDAAAALFEEAGSQSAAMGLVAEPGCLLLLHRITGSVSLSMARDLPIMVEYRISDMGYLR
jgi:hypothetical protein